MSVAVERVRTLLQRQRSLLVAGDLEGLAAMVDDIGKAPEVLTEASGSPEELEALRSLARRNAALCRASAQGVASVRVRLEELRKGNSGHETYTRDGTKQAVSVGANGAVRRV